MYVSLPKKVWRVLYPALILVGMYLLVYFVAILTWQAFFRNSYPLLEDFMVKSSDIVSAAALLGGLAAVLALFRHEIRVPSDLILKNKKYFIPVIFTGIFSCLGFDILVSACSQLFPTSQAAQGTVYPDTAYEIIILIIKSVILAPLAEELCFRGLIFGRLYAYLSVKGPDQSWTFPGKGCGAEGHEGTEKPGAFIISVVISSLLFGIYHFNILQGIYAFLCGIVMCLVYYYFKNLWASIVFHASANAFILIISYTGLFSQFPVWALLITMAAVLAASALLIFKVIKKAAKN